MKVLSTHVLCKLLSHIMCIFAYNPTECQVKWQFWGITITCTNAPSGCFHFHSSKAVMIKTITIMVWVIICTRNKFSTFHENDSGWS